MSETQSDTPQEEGVDLPNDQPEQQSRSGEVVSFFKTVALFLVAIIFLRASVVEAFKIPSGSMKSTLQIGDHILVSKLSYGLRFPFVKKSLFNYSEPARKDIVVFTRPDEKGTKEIESSINIIKRVVGLPGDKLEVRQRQVFINDQAIDEPYARWDGPGLNSGSYGPVTVPEGRVLLLGDNRDASRDSRFWEDPFLEIERIKGRALMIYWSWHDLSRIGIVIR